MLYGTYTIGILIIFLLGYSIGRRVGIKEGYYKGLAYAPIQMKKDTLKNSKCPICNKSN